MAADIVMPRLSDSMEEGTVLKWLKSVGDEVAVGDELVEIETDKANMVYEADSGGTLVEIVADEGATLPIGEVIARVGEAGEGPSGAQEQQDGEQPRDEQAKDEQPKDEDARPAGPAGAASPPPPADADGWDPPAPSPAGEAGSVDGSGSGSGSGGRVKASPVARRIAGEKGVELGSLAGSGPGGRIVKADVEKAIESGATGGAAADQEGADGDAAEDDRRGRAAAEPTAGARERPETAKGEVEVVELTKLQQTVARRMSESKATAPHFYLESEVDMTRAFEARARIKEDTPEGEVVPSFNDMIVKACAIALREFPRANGAYRDGKIEQYSRVNVGVAVAARDALVVPTVFDADRKGLRQIATETRSLAERVRDGSVTPPELSGGTFTVSNLGMYGITGFQGVINPPQAAILAIGAIAERPVVRGGEIAVARMMRASLACDHRILYGADGAELLGRIRALLEEPLGLAL